MANYGQCISIFAATVAALSGSACSLLFTTKAPPNAANLPPMASVECTSSKVAPIVDTGVAVGMGFHMVSLMRSDNAAATPLISRGADLGISAGVALLFLGSAAYGYHVTGGCHAIKRGHVNAPSSPGAFPAPGEDDKRRSRRPPPEPVGSFAAAEATRLDLPKAVGGFAFSTPPAEAEKICTASDRLWEQQGVNANCRPKVEGSSAEMARLEFDLGSLAKITILHAPAESSFNKNYDTLHTKLKVRYGKPQVWRASPSGDCSTALPECMKRGETFTGSTWALPSGRVELVPVWRDQRAFIEERYTREQAPPK